MRSWLLDTLNKAYVKILLRVGKWTVLGLLFILLMAGVSFKFVLPKAVQIAKQNSQTQIVGEGDQARIMYKDKALPKDFRDELNAQAPVMIYENQLRSTRPSDEPDLEGRPEDGPARPAGLQIGRADRNKLLDLANSFLVEWENFSPATTPAEYKAALAADVIPSSLDQIASRQDNIQIEAIKPGGQVGSRLLTDGFTPNNRMAVRRFDGRSAYLTSLGEIMTDGPSLIMKGTRYLRSYSLLVEKTTEGWKVRRAIAQTLGQII